MASGYHDSVMDIGLSEFQRKTRDTAREFLARRCPASLLRELEASETGHSPELWEEIAGLGWTALAVPEGYGGLGGSLVDVAVIVEEMGYAAYASPFLPTAVWGALPLAAAGAAGLKERILPGVADGTALLTAAIAEKAGTWDAGGVRAQIERRGDGYVLNGEKLFVDYAGVAGAIVVFARAPGSSGDGGISAVLVDTDAPGVSLTDLKSTAGRQYAVRLENVEAGAGRLLGEEGGAGALLAGTVRTGAATHCAFSVGVAQRALDMTVEHAKERVQFGQPLGKFQAVQHMCADMAMLTEGARLIAYEALWRLDEGLPAVKEVAMAKAFANEATRQTLWMAHQIHGGVGIMLEYDLHFYFRLAKELELKLGSTRDLLETVADELRLVP